jgi:branched-chain amino acid transport system ATP-binding protein
MSGAALLSARGLCKSFGAVRVIHDVSFEVRPGEVLGVLGPNGAGKTTLFNLISGDVALDAGELSFAGERLKGEPPTSAVRPSSTTVGWAARPTTWPAR